MAEPQNRDDAHKYNRVLCHRDAINGWIEKASVPDAEQQAVANVLLKTAREEVNTLFSIHPMR